jgi:MFS family permease
LIGIDLSSVSPQKTKPLVWFLAGYGVWNFANGMSQVLFPWLIAVWLSESASNLGFAQMATVVPTIALIMIGGQLADRSDLRRLLLRYDFLSMAPGLIMAVLFYLDLVGYLELIIYALAVGSLYAFNTPSRDAMLHRVAEGDLQATVKKGAMAQFGPQLLGIAAAGAAAYVGPIPLLILHSLANGLAAYCDRNLPPAPPSTAATDQETKSNIRQAVRQAARMPEIWPVLVMMIGVGFCNVGAFLVILPLQVRDMFGGSSAEMSIVRFCFWAGTIAATILLMRIGHVRYPGRIFLLGNFSGVIILTLIGLHNNFYLLALLSALWGMGAGLSMTMGRYIVLNFAPEAQRARFMAMFQLGMLGGAPAGAAIIGIMAEYLGPDGAAFPPALMMFLLVTTVLFVSRLRHLEATPQNQSTPGD